MLAGIEPRSPESPTTEEAGAETDPERDEELGPSNSAPFALSLNSRQPSTSEETELQTRSSTAVGTSANFIKRKTSQLLEAISPSSRYRDTPISPKLAALVESFRTSEIAAQLQAETDQAAAEANHTQALPDLALENNLTRGRQRASWGTQFRILSGRAFKNLYRDPALLAAHYVSAIVVARMYIFSAARRYLSDHSSLFSDLRSLVLSRGFGHTWHAEQAGCLLLHLVAVWILLLVKSESICQRAHSFHAREVRTLSLNFIVF